MPVLKNAKHERVAQSLAKGLGADKAYAAAGYKPHRGNASRLSANESIKARVAELQQKQIDRTIEHAAINTRAEMHELRRIISLAIQNGDLKTALDGQKFLLTCFGYADLPTLTHDHMTERGLQQAAPAQPADGSPQPRNILHLGRAHQKLIELAGPRVIDHDPKK